MHGYSRVILILLFTLLCFVCVSRCSMGAAFQNSPDFRNPRTHRHMNVDQLDYVKYVNKFEARLREGMTASQAVISLGAQLTEDWHKMSLHAFCNHLVTQSNEFKHVTDCDSLRPSSASSWIRLGHSHNAKTENRHVRASRFNFQGFLETDDSFARITCN